MMSVNGTKFHGEEVEPTPRRGGASPRQFRGPDFRRGLFHDLSSLVNDKGTHPATR
jgi:hypothetical protein